ncbi:MAG: OmpL47-type beta-barrel domain-containing protein, partial [Bacteroidota bacterium]
FKTYAVDNVGNHEEVIYRKIIIDDSNPSTQLEIEGDRHENILSANSAIKLIASDEYGIDAIYYSVDGSPEKKYTYKLKGSYFSQGTHVLTYYSIDKLGNKEGVKEFKFYVDKTPPTIVEEIIGKTFIANGREYSSGRSKLKLTTFDNKAGVKEVYYSINGSEYHLYDKPFYLSNTSGNLVLKTYAVDNVNNKSVVEEESTVSSIPYIDLSGPSLSHRFSGPTFVLEDTVYISRETKISLHAKDDESGLDRIEYRIDEGDLTDYTEPFSISGEGVHKIYFNGYDNVSNSNFGELMVKVDTTGPEIYTRFSIPPKGNAVMDSVNVVSYPPHLVLFLSSTDEQVGVERMYYSINNGREVPYNGLISNFKAEQRYQLKIKALDKLGNVNESLLDFGIKN